MDSLSCISVPYFKYSQLATHVPFFYLFNHSNSESHKNTKKIKARESDKKNSTREPSNKTENASLKKQSEK